MHTKSLLAVRSVVVGGRRWLGKPPNGLNRLIPHIWLITTPRYGSSCLIAKDKQAAKYHPKDQYNSIQYMHTVQ